MLNSIFMQIHVKYFAVFKIYNYLDYFYKRALDMYLLYFSQKFISKKKIVFYNYVIYFIKYLFKR